MQYFDTELIDNMNKFDYNNDMLKLSMYVSKNFQRSSLTVTWPGFLPGNEVF